MFDVFVCFCLGPPKQCSEACSFPPDILSQLSWQFQARAWGDAATQALWCQWYLENPPQDQVLQICQCMGNHVVRDIEPRLDCCTISRALLWFDSRKMLASKMCLEEHIYLTFLRRLKGMKKTIYAKIMQDMLSGIFILHFRQTKQCFYGKY